MGAPALAIAKAMRELEEARHAGDQKLLHREFRRRLKIARPRPTAGLDEIRRERHEMRLEAGAYLQGRRLDFDEIARREEAADGTVHARARLKMPTLTVEALGLPPPIVCHRLFQTSCRKLSDRSRRGAPLPAFCLFCFHCSGQAGRKL